MSPRQTRRGAKSMGIDDTMSENVSKKSSGDTTVEKRKKTRANAKSDAVDDTMSESISTKPLTPTSAQPKKRGKRQPTKTSSLESDAEQSPDRTKSTKRTVQETPSKMTRSRKKILLDNTLTDDKDPPIAVPTKTRRTRKGKENETTMDDNSVMLETATPDESSTNVNKSRGTRARKKPTKKSDPKITEDPESSSRRTNSSRNFTIIDNSVDSTMNDSARPMSNEDTEVLQVSSRISRLKTAALSSPAITSRRGRNPRSTVDDFTPESSPITVHLSPHRTTKTPRKSPMNLGSPKSHADAPLRLSKTPRKLPVVVESPIPSEHSSSNQTTPEKFIKNKTHESEKKKKSPKSAEKRKTKTPESITSVRKFSKSPKIVLRPSKSKSSKSPKLSSGKKKRISIKSRSSKSPHNRTKTPTKSPREKSLNNSQKSESSEKLSKIESFGKKSSTEKTASPQNSARMSLHLSRIDHPDSSKESKINSPTLQIKLSETIKSPTVVLNKLSRLPSSEQLDGIAKSSALKCGRNLDKNETEVTPLSTPMDDKRTSQGAMSPHRAKSTTKKRSSVTESGTPLRPTDSPSIKLVGNRKSVIISSSNNTPVEIAGSKPMNLGTRPMLSSTPRERIRRSLNLSPSLANALDAVNSPMNGEAPAGSSTMIVDGRSKRRSLRNDEETNPPISEDDSAIRSGVGASRLSGTFEVDNSDKTATTGAAAIVGKEDQDTANGTYELAEPKTPHLRRKATKRSLGDMDGSQEEDRAVKRTCRVRFASPGPDEKANKTVATVIGRSRSATPGHHVLIKRTPQTADIVFGTRAVASSSKVKDVKSRRRSNSMTNVSIIATPTTGKRRSNSVSDISARSAGRKAQLNSVNRLSKPRLSIPSAKKSDVKTPVARKAPNFAQIHQKKFAQMESLVDAKKRVEKRHLAMSSQIPKTVKATKVLTKPAVTTKVLTKPPVTSKVLTKPPALSQPIAPVVPVNGAYNRYGFKVRKDEAMKMVTQKQPALTGRKKQNDNRLLLKGVRTNRRFDLIMKARNINPT